MFTSIRKFTSKNKKKWTITFLIYADLREKSNFFEVFDTPPKILENKKKTKGLSELEELFVSLKSLPITDSIDVLIIYNRIVYSRKKINDVTYLLKREDQQTEKGFKVIKKYGNRNLIQKTVRLSKAFRDVNTVSKAKNNIIFTWEHGSIFGVFKEFRKEEIDERNSVIVFSRLEKTSFLKNMNYNVFLSENTLKKRYFSSRKTLVKERPFKDILSQEEFGRAILLGFRQNKIKLVVMLNCSTQNIFTCFSLKNACNMLVAPMGSITVPGYDYEKILKKIISEPKIKEASLASFITFSTAQLIAEDQSNASWAIFGVNLLFVKEYIDITNSLSDILIKKLTKNNEFKVILNNLQGTLFYYDNEKYIADLGQFLTLLVDFDRELFMKIQNEFSVLKGNIIMSTPFIGKDVEKHAPSGLTVLFPKFIESFVTDDDIPPKFFLQFSKRTRWIDFLSLFIEKSGVAL